jgi:FdrA protein
MSSERVLLRRGVYADSVTLLQVSRQVGQAAGVQDALVGLATELNLELLAGMGFRPPGIDSANDLFIAVRAEDEQAADAAAALAERLLSAPARTTGGTAAELPPRTVGSAAAAGGGLVLVSVPGQHAFAEAMDALDAGCDVLVFSDNVSVADEIRLKDAAASRGLLVMGPDCGTAVVGGLGLGFSHTLDRGPVGLVAASGTGAQQLLCLLDAAGVGVSAALGVGGRDLSEPVAGRSTLAALEVLDSDPARSSSWWCPSRPRTRSPSASARPPRAWPPRSGSHCSAPASRTSPRPRRRCWPSWRCRCPNGRRGSPPPSPGRERCAGCSAAGRCATRRC